MWFTWTLLGRWNLLKLSYIVALVKTAFTFILLRANEFLDWHAISPLYVCYCISHALTLIALVLVHIAVSYKRIASLCYTSAAIRLSFAVVKHFLRNYTWMEVVSNYVIVPPLFYATIVETDALVNHANCFPRQGMFTNYVHENFGLWLLVMG